MKTACLLLAGATACLAQTAVYDTSLLKAGNTWTYSVHKGKSSVGTQVEGYAGIRRYTIDSLWASADSVVFRLTQFDSLTLVDFRVPDTVIVDGQTIVATKSVHKDTMTTRSDLFTFRGNTFSSVPFFMSGQAFTADAPRGVYQGDTLRRNEWWKGGGTCMQEGWSNLERVGRTYEGFYNGGCGMSSTYDIIQLAEFNGVMYVAADIRPVALRGLVRRSPTRGNARLSWQGRGGATFGSTGEAFDLRGRASGRAPSIPRAAP